MRYYTTLAILWALFVLPGFAQPLEVAPSFAEKLEAMDATLSLPLDAGYESVLPVDNPFQNYDFAINSEIEDMEIRYFVLPYNEQDTVTMSPDVLCLRTSTAVATNDEDSFVSMLPIMRRELVETFGADWGLVYFFRPKTEFAAYQHCRMLMLYKDQVGSMFVFFLFNDPNNEAVDLRYPAVQFVKDTPAGG
jgi:hypothetical protein